MPPHPLPTHVALGVALITFVFCGTLGAMVGAWSWAIGRLRTGRPLLPPPGPRRVPWGLGSVLVVLLLWLAVNLGVSILFLKLSGHAGKGWKPTPAQQMEMVSLINVVLLVAVPPLLRLLSGARLDALGIGLREPSRQAMAGTIGFLLVTPVVYLLNFLALLIWEPNRHPVEEMTLGEPTVRIAGLAFLSAVILAPAAEELIFRGIFQNWLAKLFRPESGDEGRGRDLDGPPETAPEAVEPSDLQTAGGIDDVLTMAIAAPASTPEPDLGTVPGDVVPIRLDAPILPQARTRTHSRLLPRLPRFPAGTTDLDWASIAPIAITSAVFAAVHLPQWPAPLAIFILAIGLGLVYQRTGSLLASFVMHALFNGISTMMLFQQMLIGHPVDPKVAPTAAYSAAPGPEMPAPAPRPPGPTCRRP